MWYKITGGSVEFRIVAKPNARRSEVLGITQQGLSVAIKARPTDGAANIELIAFLAKLLHVAKRDIVLRRGGSARYKALVLPLNADVKAFIVTMEAAL